MAKKKAMLESNGTANDNHQNHNQEAPETDKKATALSRQSSMEEHDSSEEKLQNLKSLNAMLLKQTVEKRQQIDSLVQAKDALETELARQKTGLLDELDHVADDNFGLKMELDFVMDFVGNRFREMGDGVERLVREKDDRESDIRVLKREADHLLSEREIESERLRKVCDERDSINKGSGLLREEANRLKESLICLEEKGSNLETVIGKLKSENDRSVKKRRMREEMIEGLNKQKSDLEKTMDEKKREIDGLKREIKVLLGVKKEMETVKIDQRGEIEELEKRVEQLNETVHSLTKEDKVLRDLVIELEKNLDESMAKERAMLVQIDALGKEKTIKESELERLTKEKNSAEKQLEMTNAQLSDQEKSIHQLSRERVDLYELTVNREIKRLELNQKVDELTHTVAVLQKNCDGQAKTNEKLSCKVGELSDALEQVKLAREKADKALDEEKRQGEDLRERVLQSEKMTETTLGELEKVKIGRQSLYTAKKDFESQFESLKSEKAILEKGLVELKRAMNALKTELESAGMDSKSSLVMLESAASMVSKSDNREGRFISEQQKQENGTESYGVVLESIERAFKKKEDIIEKMKKEVDSMKQSMEEAHKEKSFWTTVSSVTTIFAAASFAFASRTR